MTETQKLNSWYDKIEATINSAKTHLHLRVCVAMYSQFVLAFPDNDEDQEALLKLLEVVEEKLNGH